MTQGKLVWSGLFLAEPFTEARRIVEELLGLVKFPGSKYLKHIFGFILVLLHWGKK